MKTVKWRKWSFIPRWYQTSGLVDILQIVNTPYGGIGINKIKSEDPSYMYHDHPWSFVSIILRGGYSERIWNDWSKFDENYERWRGPLSIHRIGNKQTHQIYECRPNTYTLFIYGPWRRKGFRFYAHGKKADLSRFIKGLEPGSNEFVIYGRDHTAP